MKLTEKLINNFRIDAWIKYSKVNDRKIGDVNIKIAKNLRDFELDTQRVAVKIWKENDKLPNKFKDGSVERKAYSSPSFFFEKLAQFNTFS